MDLFGALRSSQAASHAADRMQGQNMHCWRARTLPPAQRQAYGTRQWRRSSKLRVQRTSVAVNAVEDVLAPLKLEHAVVQQISKACTTISKEQLQSNVKELTGIYLLKDVQVLLSSTPQALALPVADWRGFFDGYGLGKEALWKALRYSSSKLAGADLYTAGAAIRWLKQLGPWTDADIANRLIPCYPEVLATSTEQLQQLVDKLTDLGIDVGQIQEMLWEFPGLLADFREEHLPLIKRMVESRRDKYKQGGFYID